MVPSCPWCDAPLVENGEASGAVCPGCGNSTDAPAWRQEAPTCTCQPRYVKLLFLLIVSTGFAAFSILFASATYRFRDERERNRRELSEINSRSRKSLGLHQQDKPADSSPELMPHIFMVSAVAFSGWVVFGMRRLV